MKKKKKKAKKFDKIIVSKEYQEAVFLIVSQFPDEDDKSKLTKFFMNEQNFDIIYPLYKQFIKNQLTDTGIKFLAIKIYESIKS